MIGRLRRLRESNEEGFTLIELLAATVLIAMVMSVLAGVFISTMLAQQTVGNRTDATNDAQVAASGLDYAIRNASEFQLSVANTSDQLLVVRTATAGSSVNWTCASWYFSSAKQELRQNISPVGTMVSAPSASQLDQWTLVANGVTPATGSTIFSSSGGKLTVAFHVLHASNDEPTAIQFMTAKLTTPTETHACY
jgi:prepilin-type N-terminal cleavage/methylation domain-containing protein